jgi:hypothetical protein
MQYVQNTCTAFFSNFVWKVPVANYIRQYTFTWYVSTNRRSEAYIGVKGDILHRHETVNLMCGWPCIVIQCGYENQLVVTCVFFISFLLVAQNISGNHVPIIRSWRTHLWTHYLPTSLDYLPAATAHTNTRRKHHEFVSSWWWAHGCPKYFEQLVEKK